MVQMASVDYVKTFFNWNEKALSSDIDHEKKHVSGDLVIHIL